MRCSLKLLKDAVKQRHDELKALPPAAYHLAFRSIKYGADEKLLFPKSGIQAAVSNPVFSLRCFPSPKKTRNPRPLWDSAKALRPTPPPALKHTTHASGEVLTADEIRKRLIRMNDERKPWFMELTVMASKKRVHKHAVVRNRCVRRLKETIRLVVARGANVDAGGEIIFEREHEGPRRWLLPGFSYVAAINIELYRHPLPSLIQLTRSSLADLKRKASQKLMEQSVAIIDGSAAEGAAGEPKKGSARIGVRSNKRSGSRTE